MKPICVLCQRFYRCKKNGFTFIEAMPAPCGPDEDYPSPGTSEPGRWQPYKLWEGDLWECQGCHAQIVVGVGRSPIAEHYEPDFQQKVQAEAPEMTVNDC